MSLLTQSIFRPHIGRPFHRADRVTQSGCNVTVSMGLEMARTTTTNTAARRAKYTLNGALDLSALLRQSTGCSFPILTKSTDEPITRRCMGKPEGNIFSASGYHRMISYESKSENDVILTITTAQNAWSHKNFGTTGNSDMATDTFEFKYSVTLAPNSWSSEGVNKQEIREDAFEQASKPPRPMEYKESFCI